MSTLIEKVKLKHRFARSARIDADLLGTPPLSGYVLQASTRRTLSSMAKAIADGDQFSFTWTGPYGGGKSSAALLVGNLVAGNDEGRMLAVEIAGPAFSELYNQAFQARCSNWHVVPVTGSRRSLRDAIAAMARQALGWTDKVHEKSLSSDAGLIQELLKSTETVGILLMIDELGKFLEHSVESSGDIHLLQDLAEAAARQDGKLVIVGILHKSFEAYADRISSNARDEWAKIQGRFQDLSFVSAADETVQLLAEAMESEASPHSASEQADRVAELVSSRRPVNVEELSRGLTKTWPLNPICSLLLGGITRQRFGQNERSVFGFLASAEPYGFKEFLAQEADEARTYDPSNLWDYLQANFEIALSSGQDSTKFSLACEAIERAAVLGSALHVQLTKSAAILDLFKNGSGLQLSDESLAIAVPTADKRDINKAVKELCDWGLLVAQSKLGGYALFAGSDFDLDAAIKGSIAPLSAQTLRRLPALAGISHIIAKKHYFEKGVLRSFSLVVLKADADATSKSLARDMKSVAKSREPILFLLLLDGKRDAAEFQRLIKRALNSLDSEEFGAVIGYADMQRSLLADLSDLQAIEAVEKTYLQLEGDRIARRAIRARKSLLTERVITDFQQMTMKSRWFFPAIKESLSADKGLSAIATQFAEIVFSKTPVIHSELLQKRKPSSSAAKALRILAYAMVENGSEPNLGFEGFPAEYGLYLTLLRPFGLHREIDGKWQFSGPDESPEGKSLQPAWNCLHRSGGVILSEVYEQWRTVPFGMKDGIMPLIALAFILANRTQLAIYQEGQFQVEIDKLFVDRLLQDASLIKINPADRSTQQSAFLSRLACAFELEHATSIEVAKSLFQQVERQSSYAQRTATVSKTAQTIRDVIRHAQDPEALLFEDLPSQKLKGDLVENVVHSLEEVDGIYGQLLDEMQTSLARALGTTPDTFEGVKQRAKNIAGLSGDLWFEAFVNRLIEGDGDVDVESILGLIQSKPPKDWSDRNRDEALIKVAQIGRRFREIEAVAIVRNRKSETEALALVVGVDPNQPPLLHSFELSAQERASATSLANEILANLVRTDDDQNMKIAALARAIAALSGELAEIK
ncbi:MAG: hypothetical protein V7676_18470 [Parasphingorhabdus sp.]|uniref:hypothetical protein n=1 Tax=Parasphingorhabdus sp. TaxID=2709688 RepID=UPI0030017A7C